MSNNKVETTTAGGALIGVQSPDKKEMDELIKSKKLKLKEVVVFLQHATNEEITSVAKHLQEKKHDDVVNTIKEFCSDKLKETIVREAIKLKLNEFVRKNAAGTYTLYNPFKKKSGHAVPAANFPTLLGAKAAEYARFPPKDPDKKARLKHDIEKLKKSKEKKFVDLNKDHNILKQKHTKKKSVAKKKIKKIKAIANESKIVEKLEQNWDEFFQTVPKQIILSDKTMQSLHNELKKVADKTIKEAVEAIQYLLKKHDLVVKSKITKSTDEGLAMAEFSVSGKDGVGTAGPFLLNLKDGVPFITVTDTAKNSLTTLDTEQANQISDLIVSIQEDVLDMETAVEDVLKKRNEALKDQELEIDNFVADLTPLQLSILKNLLVNKYRKLN